MAFESELAQARNALRKMELALGAVEDAIVWMNADGRVEWCNAVFDRLVELNHLEALGSRLTYILPLEDEGQPVETEAHPARLALKVERLAPKIYEMRQVSGLIVLEISASRVRMDEKDLSLVFVLRDVTERERAAAKIREAEARYRLLLDHIPITVYMDAVNNISSNLYSNPHVEKLLGYSMTEWLADSELWPKLLHPADREWVMAKNQQANVLNQPLQLDYRLVARDGRVVWVHDESVIFQNTQGAAVCRLGVITDITARKETEELLRATEENLRQAVRRAELLLRVATRFNEQMNLTAMLQAVCEEVAQAMQVSVVTVSLYDTAREILVLAADYGLPPFYREQLQPVPRAVYEALVNEYGPLSITADVQAFPDLPNAALYKQLDLRTTVNVSLIHKDQLVGRLNLGTLGEVRTFNEEDLMLLPGLAAQAALALHNIQRTPIG